MRPMPRPCSRWPFLAAVLLTTAAGGAPAKPPEVPPARVDVDPMRAPVPPPPAYRSTLSDEEYAEKYADVAADLGPPLPADGPTVAVNVLGVDKGSVAERVGLHAGDAIVAIDGQRLDGGLADLKRIRASATGPQVLSVLSAGRTRQVTVPPGLMGTTNSDGWLLEAQYMHDLPAGTPPSEQVRVASKCCLSDPDLALAALARASGPAASGPFVYLIAASASSADGQMEDALAYAMAARAALPAGTARRLDAMAVRPAIATFRWPLAKALGSTDEVVLAAVDAYEARPHAAAEADPVTAGNGRFVGQLKRLENLTTRADGLHANADWYVKNLRDNGKTSFDSPDGHFAQADVGPLAANVDAWARYHYKANAVTQHDWGQAGQIGLWDGWRAAVTLVLAPGGMAQIEYDRHPVVTLSLPHLIGNDRHFTVRVTAVGDRIEYTIDGRRVFYGPLPADLADEAGRKLPPLHLGWVGIKGDVEDFHYRTMGPREP